jgi:hypothetical protein
MAVEASKRARQLHRRALPKNWFALVKQDIIENLKLERAHVIRRT